MASPSENGHPDSPPEAESPVDPTNLSIFARMCHLDAASFLHGLEVEYGPDMPTDMRSDQRVMAATVFAESVWKHHPQTEYGLRPERIFLGLAIDAIATSPERRSPEEENMVKFFSSNFDWGSREELLEEVLLPLVAHIDPSDKTEIDLYAREKARKYTLMLPDLSIPVFMKLENEGYAPAPKSRAARLWQQYGGLIARVRHRHAQHADSLRRNQDVDYKSDLAAIRYFTRGNQ